MRMTTINSPADRIATPFVSGAVKTPKSAIADDKAMLRRRLAKGPGAPWEYARVAGLKVWTTFSKVTRLRREIQLMAVKP